MRTILRKIVVRYSILHKYEKMNKPKNLVKLDLPFNVTSEIAKEVNKSDKTVSQILNGHLRDYPKETIIKVYEQAKIAIKKKGKEAVEGLERIDAAIEQMMAA